MTANLINYWSYKENSRHNKVTEAESKRHNLETERLSRDSLAETFRHNVAVEVETNRSNVARETETNRHNVVVELETERTNRANEAIKRESNKIGWANVALGHSQVQLGYAQLEETKRRNRAAERQNLLYLAETRLHNRKTERITQSYNEGVLTLRELESDRSYELGLAGLDIEAQKLEETIRSHKASEALQDYRNVTDRANAWIKGADLVLKYGSDWFGFASANADMSTLISLLG